MKRILAMGLMAAVVATSVQAQNSGLTAAGSNFTGPGGGGGGATGSVGAFLPASSGSYTWGGANGGPRYGVAAGFANATGPAAVTVGSITVTVSAAAQLAASNAVTAGNVSAFVESLGSAMPPAAAAALGNALSALGSAARAAQADFWNASDAVGPALENAIAQFRAAVNALPAGAAVPESLIAARAVISGYYIE